MNLVVWIEAPHKVLAVDPKIIFGFQQDEIVGESIEILAGPLSNLSLFQSAITDTWALKSSVLQLILYDINKRKLQLMVSCEPLLTEGIFVGCLARFRLSEAVTLGTVFATMKQSSSAQCLVSSGLHHEIQMLNDAFVKKFGCVRDDVLGKPWSVLAPLVDGSLDCSSLIRATGDGSIRRTNIAQQEARVPRALEFACLAPFEEVVYVPVVEAPNGRIRHVLVLVPSSIQPHPLPPSSSSCSPIVDRIGELNLGASESAHGQDPSAAAALANLNVPGGPDARQPQGSPGTSAASEPEAPCPALIARSSLPLRAGDSPPLLPHRRAFRAVEAARPPQATAVVFTPGLLDALRGQPVPAAARAAGVSVTAFKRACRRLGVRRWEFRRGPARNRRDGSGAPSA